MNRYRLTLDQYGRGPAVVLLHGLLGSRRYWRRVAQCLEKDFHVFAVDLLGFGDSPKPPVRYNAEEHIAALHETLSAHLSTSEKIALIGHSMGALLSLRYAIAHGNQVKTLVLINPPGYSTWPELHHHARHSWDAFTLNFFARGFAGRVVCWLHGRFPGLFIPIARIFAKGLPREVAEDSLKHSWASYHGSFENILLGSTMEQLLEQVRAIPILVIASEADEHTSADFLRQLSRQANVHLEMLSGGHHLPIEQSEAICELIKRHLAGELADGTRTRSD